MTSAKLSRKKFVAWSLGIWSLFAVPPAFKLAFEKNNRKKTEKMLTQNGELVDVDIAAIPSQKKKIKEAEICTWVHKKNSAHPSN